MEQRQAEEKSILTVNTVETHMNPRSANPVAGAVQDAGKSTTLRGYAEGRTGRCQRTQSS